MTAMLYPPPPVLTSRRNGHWLRCLVFAIWMPVLVPIGALAQSDADLQNAAGPLDTPLAGAIVDKTNPSPAGTPSGAPSRAPDNLRPDRPDAAGAASLKTAVREEQDTLEQLPRSTLNARALRNERAAQIALGVSFAREAALLGFSVTAANEAASDAARWFYKAASQGFPGAPSLDIAGVRHYPIRASRIPIQ